MCTSKFLNLFQGRHCYRGIKMAMMVKRARNFKILGEVVDYCFLELGAGAPIQCARTRTLAFTKSKGLEEYVVISAFSPINGGEETVIMEPWENWSSIFSSNRIPAPEEETIVKIVCSHSKNEWVFHSWAKR